MLPFYGAVSKTIAFLHDPEVEASWTSKDGGFYRDKICETCATCSKGHVAIENMLTEQNVMTLSDCRNVLLCERCNPCIECDERRKKRVIPKTFDEIRQSHTTQKFRVTQYPENRRVVFGQLTSDGSRFARFEEKKQELAFTNPWIHFKVSTEKNVGKFAENPDELISTRWCIRYTFTFEFHQVEMTIIMREGQKPVIQFEIEMVKKMFEGYSSTYVNHPDIINILSDPKLPYSIKQYDFFAEVVCIEFFLTKHNRLPLPEEFLLLSTPMGLTFTRDQFNGVRDAWMRNTKGSLFSTGELLGKARNLKFEDIVHGGLNGGVAVTHKANGLMSGIFRDRSGYWLFLDSKRYWLLSNEGNVSNGKHPVIFGELIPQKRSATDVSDISIFLAFDEFLAASQQEYHLRHESLGMHRRLFSPMRAENNFGFIEKPIALIRPSGWSSITDAISSLGKDLVVSFGEKRYQIQTDGFVFTPVDSTQQKPDGMRIRDLRSRVLHRSPDICKWKPVHELTVDLKWDGQNWLASDRQDTIPVDVVVKKTPPSVGIWELGPNESGDLEVRRARFDKPFPNSMMVVRNVLSDIKNPFTIFPGELVNFRFINRMVKRKCFANVPIRGADVIDFGIGRGGTLPYLHGVKTIVGIEPNKDHLDECAARHSSTNNQASLIPVNEGAEKWKEVLESLDDEHLTSNTLVIVSMLSMSHFDPDILIQCAVEAKRRRDRKVFVVCYAIDEPSIFAFAQTHGVDTTKPSWVLEIGSLKMTRHPDGKFTTQLDKTIVDVEDTEKFTDCFGWIIKHTDVLRCAEIVNLSDIVIADPLDLEFVSAHKGFVLEMR